MTLEEFTATLEGKTPPPVSPPLVALWHDGKGDWNRAHEVAQDVDDETGAWVHAYLHRKEGDESNAAYWYRRAAQARRARLSRCRVETDRRSAAQRPNSTVTFGSETIFKPGIAARPLTSLIVSNFCMAASSAISLSKSICISVTREPST